MRLEFLKRSPTRAKAMEMRRSLWMRRRLSKKNTPSKQTPKKLTGTPKKGTTPRKQTPRKSTPRKQTSKSQTPRKSTTPGKCRTPRKHTPRKSTCSLRRNQEDEARRNEINENGKRSWSDSNDCSGQNQSNVSSTSNDSLELSDTQRRVRVLNFSSF